MLTADTGEVHEGNTPELGGRYCSRDVRWIRLRRGRDDCGLHQEPDQSVFPECQRRGGAENAAKQLGAKVIQYVPTKPDSIPEQLSQVEDVIVKKPDAIVFTPVDYKALIPGVEKMNAAGIPVVNVTDHMAGGKIVSYVGIDDYKVGRATAEALMKALGGKGNVVIIEGVKGWIANNARTRGLTDVVKAHPAVTR